MAMWGFHCCSSGAHVLCLRVAILSAGIPECTRCTEWVFLQLSRVLLASLYYTALLSLVFGRLPKCPLSCVKASIVFSYRFSLAFPKLPIYLLKFHSVSSSFSQASCLVPLDVQLNCLSADNVSVGLLTCSMYFLTLPGVFHPLSEAFSSVLMVSLSSHSFSSGVSMC